MEDRTPILVLRIMVNNHISSYLEKINPSLRFPSFSLSYMDVNFWGCSISIESRRKIEKINNSFINYNPKIKSNKTYHILLIEASISTIEIMGMNRNLIYKHKTTNTKYMRLSYIASNPSQNNKWLKMDCHKYSKYWLNH